LEVGKKELSLALEHYPSLQPIIYQARIRAFAFLINKIKNINNSPFKNSRRFAWISQFSLLFYSPTPLNIKHGKFALLATLHI
jgi:hypothetical protein